MLAAGDFNDPRIQAVTISVGGQDLLTKAGSRNRLCRLKFGLRNSI